MITHEKNANYEIGMLDRIYPMVVSKGPETTNFDFTISNMLSFPYYDFHVFGNIIFVFGLSF